MQSTSVLVSGTFILYALGMLGIGLWSYKKTQTMSDYVLGGRSLGATPTALSAGASDMSAWLLLGLPGYAYVSGLEALWIALGLLIGTWLNWHIIAQRLRAFSEALSDSLTLADYFENRFADNTRALRVITSVLILFFFTFYTASGLVAGGKLFNSVFGLPYEWAVVLGALAIIAYTMLGGFLAVTWTDVIQALLMFAALLIVPFMLYSQMDAELATTIKTIKPHALDPFTNAKGDPLSWIAIVSLLAWGLGYFGQPHILARFKAIKHQSAVPTARRIATTWAGLGLIGAVTTGLVAIAYVPTPLADSEQVFILLINALFHPVVAGVLLAAILAAVMSTADSQLLVASSSFAEDIYRLFIKRDADQQHLVQIGRFSVVVIAAIACVIALVSNQSVLSIVSYAWAGLGAAFGPALIYSLYWKNMNRNGAIAGILAGGLSVIIWKNLNGGIFDIYEILPGFIIASIAIVVVTKASGAATRNTEEIYNKGERSLRQ